jgi:hypothetical protein
MAELEEKQAEEVSTEVEEKGQEVADKFAEADQKADPEVTPPSVEEVAASIGWTPKDKFTGPEEKWKPADQFIIDGRKAERNMKRRLDEMSSTLETVSKTSASIMEEKLREQADALAAKYETAVEAGDTRGAAAALRDHDRVMAKANGRDAAARPTPARETEEWAAKNARVLKDPLAQQRAIELCEPYAKANYSAADQLAAIDPILRREFPHLFDDKPPPGVEAPRTRSAAPPKRGNTVADMPKEAQEIAKDLADRKLINSPEDYARNYFAMIAKG